MDESLPTRWEIELEFVQSLANIQYLNYLAQNNYLTNPEFLNYLNYLNYWKSPEYSKYLVYPNCLHILTLLQNEEFRKNIVNPEFMNTLMNDMVKRWQDQDPHLFEMNSQLENNNKESVYNIANLINTESMNEISNQNHSAANLNEQDLSIVEE